MSLAFLIAVSALLVFYGNKSFMHPDYHRMRLRLLNKRRLRIEARLRRGQYPYTPHKEHTVCNRCARQLASARAPTHAPIPTPGPTLEDVRNALGGREVPDVTVASTGCELTDQIFAAARKKGIMPVDVIGPAPNYDD